MGLHYDGGIAFMGGKGTRRTRCNLPEIMSSSARQRVFQEELQRLAEAIMLGEEERRVLRENLYLAHRPLGAAKRIRVTPGNCA